MYKDLNLNRQKLINSLKKFCSVRFANSEVSELIEKGSTRRRVNFIGDGMQYFIDFQFKIKNGSTTIETHGDNSELKTEIAEFIKNDAECVIGEVDAKNKWFVVDKINHNDFLGIIELLKESPYCKECKSEDIKDTKHDQYSLNGCYDEQLKIHYYNSTKTIVCQGRPLLLFHEALVYITEVLEPERIPEVFKDYYRIDISKDSIVQQYKHYMHNSHDKHTRKLKSVLCQAVYNLNLEGNMFDYGYLVFPAFKALEGHLKNILYNNHNITCEDQRFSMFRYDKTNKKHVLQEDFHKNFDKKEKIQHVADAYNLYCGERNKLFHWGDPAEPVDLTFVIENIGNAKQLIIDTITLIDKYYMS